MCHALAHKEYPPPKKILRPNITRILGRCEGLPFPHFWGYGGGGKPADRWRWAPVYPGGGGLHRVLREGTGRSGRLPCLVQGGRKSRRGSSGCSGRGQNADSPESSTLIYRPRPRQRHLLCREEGAEGTGTGTALPPGVHSGTHWNRAHAVLYRAVFTLSDAPNPLWNGTLIVRCRVLPQFPHCQDGGREKRSLEEGMNEGGRWPQPRPRESSTSANRDLAPNPE